MDNPCSRCGSAKIVPDVPLAVDVSVAGGTGIESGVGSVVLHVSGAPKAWVFKDTATVGLSGNVCGECGNVDLQVQNYRVLYEKYRKSQDS